jgi:glycosyltransferase involved in cell wall biosynthesis
MVHVQGEQENSTLSTTISLNTLCTKNLFQYPAEADKRGYTQKKNMPKVSVIIPVFNCEAYVTEAIRSVMDQTWRNLEILVVDDGSTDNSPTLIAELAAEDPRIRILRQENSGKASIPRNAAISFASGDFVSFLDADDLYKPEKIERELRVFSLLPDVGLVFSDMEVSKAFGKDTPKTYLANVEYLRKAAPYLEHIEPNIYLCKPNFYNFMSTQITGISTQTVMIRQELLKSEKKWFSEDMTVGEDIDLYFRLAKQYRVGFINEALSVYRYRESSLTDDPQRLLNGSIAAHSQNLKRAEALLSREEIRSCKRRIANDYLYLGYYFFKNLNKQDARRSYRSSMRTNFSMKTLQAYMKTYLPGGIIKAHWRRSEKRNSEMVGPGSQIRG